MTQENFESTVTRDIAIQERCRTIRTICWTTIVAGIAATTVVNAIVAFKGLGDAMKMSRQAAQYVGTYEDYDGSESI